MIENIEKLDKLGIYSKIPPINCDNFDRYNLIYGWNGSGKSTLSRFLGFLGGVNPGEYDFSKVNFIVKIDGDKYNKNKIPLNDLNIHVFNGDFVEYNIDWNNEIKSILLLDESNIDEIKEYNDLKNDLYDMDNGLYIKKDSLNKKISDISTKVDKLSTNIAKHVKDSFIAINTSDRTYTTYTKRNLKKYLDDSDFVKSSIYVLKDDTLKEAIVCCKPNKMDHIDNEIKLVDTKCIEDIVEESKRLCSTLITSKVINELKDDCKLSNWVEEGLKLHIDNNKKNVHFVEIQLIIFDLKNLKPILVRLLIL